MLQFNFKRFGLVIQKDFTENIRIVLNTILIFLFVELIFLLLEIINSTPGIIILSKSMWIYYYIGLFILGVVFAGFSFPALRKTEKAVNYLILPSSILEKYLSFWLLSSFGFLFLYTIMFFILNYAVVYIFNLFNPDYIQSYLYFDPDIYFNLILIYFNLNALYLLGAATYRKVPHFKTTLIAISSILGIGIIILISLYFLKNYAFSYNGNKISGGGTIVLPAENIFPVIILKYLVMYGLMITFWIAGYLKLKEKEI